MSRRRSIGPRLALASAALVAACLAALLALVYFATLSSARAALDQELGAELDALSARLAEGGVDALTVEVERRVRVVGRDGTVYRLEAGARRALAGNLERWPEGARPGSSWATFEAVAPEGALSQGAGPEGALSQDAGARLRVRVLELDDGLRLLVGRPSTEHERVTRHLRAALAIGAVAALVLAIGAGLALSHGLLRRVEAMGATVRRIRAGERARRVPVGARRDEFDELARSFNELLDENDELLEQVRGLADDVAHDLRTPLTRLRHRVEALLAAPRAAERDAEALADIRAELDGLLDTFQALLAIAQLEGGELRERMTRVELAALARDAVELYEPLADEAGRRIELDLDEGAAVLGEPQLLTQALTNLIDNALKHGAGPITVFARRAGASVELGVADRGPGVPPEERRRVLRRFARLDAARHRPGAGLGLSFVEAVARAHRAELELADARPGLLVHLRFPAAT